jgi:hypothetical protein
MCARRQKHDVIQVIKGAGCGSSEGMCEWWTEVHQRGRLKVILHGTPVLLWTDYIAPTICALQSARALRGIQERNRALAQDNLSMIESIEQVIQ